MRATALLHRLPHATDTELHRHGRKRAKASRSTPAASAHNPTTDPRSTGSQIVQRVRSAGGPIDNASYTCACGFVFAASVSTTVRCPHCGADQAW
jgi:hypothetical protein